MTDPTPRDLDQLASDLVDGLLPPAEAARARREPEIAARVARIEQVRSALRTVPTASPAQVNRAVSTAVAAAAAEASPVRQLAPRTSRPLGERARPWLAAAAVIVIAGLAMAGLMRIDPSGDEDVANEASSAPPEDKTEEQAGDDEGGVFDAGDGGSSSTTARLADDLGAAASPDELAALVADGVESFAAENGVDIDSERSTVPGDDPVISAPNAAEGADTACPGLSAAGDPARGTSIYSADATYQGAAVRVHVYESGGEARLVATTQSCTDVVDTPFTP